jgi:hypothetical protein
MGEYFSWVNVDRREFLSPHDFGYGNKWHESLGRSNELLRALHSLLSNEWKGCHVFWMGDESPLPDETDLEMFITMKAQCSEIGYGNGGMFDMVCETYRNLSGLFKGADDYEIKCEIDYYLEDLKGGEGSMVNEYGIDPLNPYDGLFLRDGADFRYIINTSKKVAYSFEHTKILYPDGEEANHADPLPLLLGYGHDHKLGEWLGDVIEVSDELPQGFTLLDKILYEWWA